MLIDVHDYHLRVSDGGLGGARMVEQPRLIAVALRTVPISQALKAQIKKSNFMS